ncbi:MAG: DNA polymerase III subunit epsilon [Clostridia bacterium]|nr:MAG: DNA polymerase III subunit epsilon [Clostridia bacterium]
MSRIYVALDLETTGLDSEKDTIIELGALRFRDGEILEKFSQVVNPGRRIPPNIQQLTGISQAEADAAPPLSQVASAFRKFVGDAPVVGHNVGFDIGFMRTHDLYNFNPLLDTFELALITLPGLPSYKLGRVAEHLDVSLENAHRAYDDAEATMRIFERMRAKLLDTPHKTIEQIANMAQRVDWPLGMVFEDVLREQAIRWAQGVRPKVARTALDEGALFRREPPLEPVEHPEPLDVDALAALLEPGGPFDSYFEHYEHRQPQVAMLRTVADAFNRGRHLLIEAGTGTGKSIAYLIPALAWAVQTGQRVVVSSNTINLQDQLFNKDLPDLHHILPFDFKATVMKGRSNYLCPRRLNKMLQRGDLTPVEVSVLARILLWLPTTETGDVSDLTLVNAQERAVWQRVCSDSHSCSANRCGVEAAQPCYFYKARNQAEAAHLIIANHALLLADIATEGGVLPAYNHLIVDEAHHLEEAATKALTASLDHESFVSQLRELAPLGGAQQAVGLLSDVVTAVRKAGVPNDKADALSDFSRRLVSAIPGLDMQMDEYIDTLDRFLMQHFGRKYDNSTYDLRLRITKSVRVQPAWVDVEIVWDNLSYTLANFIKDLERLISKLKDLSNYRIPNHEDLVADLETALEDITQAFEIGNEITLTPDENAIYWVRRSKFNGSLTLNRAPLHVGGIIEENIFRAKDTVVLTSATLRTAKSFDYMRNRLNAFDVEELALDSPFDYKTSALVYLPTDMPEPNQPAYQGKVEEAIVQLSLATQGRLMALFTSYAQLLRTADAIRALLEDAGVTLFVQGRGGSRQQILSAFRQTEKAVIMGTRSFWEGVDVQGDSLSALIITKLPFSVPTDPIISARSETFDNSFYQFSVPEAILNLRQGFGRLIRSTSDRGIAVLLDKRLVSKRYGRLFLESLPDVTFYKAPLGNMPDIAHRWLAGEDLPNPPRRSYRNGPPEPPPEPPGWWGG